MPVRFLPEDRWYDTRDGESVLEAADRAGISLEHVCGGRGTCGKCRIILLEGELSPVTSNEREALSQEALQAGHRLACQARFADASRVVIGIPRESQQGDIRILSAGVSDNHSADPWARRIHLTVPPAELADQTADLAALERAWRVQSPEPLCLSLGALRQLPGALRTDAGRVSLTRVDGTITSVDPGHRRDPILGMAFDIGTTTVVGYLLDLTTGQELAVASELNPQTRHGDNVVSRIQFAETPGGLTMLQEMIVTTLNRIVVTATEAAASRPDQVVAVTVVGNTTMLHLLLGVSPTHLAQSPYVPVITRALRLAGGELGLNCNPGAVVWLLPSIAGWVGADTVGVLLATGIYAEAEPALAIDIGTNGEMAMGSRDRLITCSTAACPAFEGAHISCGMRASAGAIDQVRIDDDVHWHTIANDVPRGICGSGLVDAVSELLRVGIIDSQGRLQSPEKVAEMGMPALAARIQGENRHRTFDVVTDRESPTGQPVRLTQRDIRELQLAKGAVRAGIEILMKELELAPEDVRKVFLAGAFGNYIQPESALGIGLLPEFPRAQIIPVGNAAGAGARMALLSRASLERASALLEHVEYLELSARTDFQDEFISAMLFQRPK